MTWLTSEDGRQCAAYLGANLVIELQHETMTEVEYNGWTVSFCGVKLLDRFPVLSFAKTAGLDLAKRILTQALVIADGLSDEVDG